MPSLTLRDVKGVGSAAACLMTWASDLFFFELEEWSWTSCSRQVSSGRTLNTHQHQWCCTLADFGPWPPCRERETSQRSIDYKHRSVPLCVCTYKYVCLECWSSITGPHIFTHSLLFSNNSSTTRIFSTVSNLRYVMSSAALCQCSLLCLIACWETSAGGDIMRQMIR